MRRALLAVLALTLALIPIQSFAFCGFYVAKADTKLFNKASKVVLVRDGERTVLTMANDFKGEMKEFAIVVPVPTLLEKGQIHIGDNAVLDHLDAYSAPRLVEYYDDNPCAPQRVEEMALAGAGVPAPQARAGRAKDLGVKIEAQYTIGEYDILILSAEQSQGLETWLIENGYKLPTGAAPVLGSYLKQGMKFFVAKVNIEEQSKLGFNYLRPIQVAFNSPKFMLPIRLGMLNADGDQELFVYGLTKKGRIEPTNYRLVKLPEGVEIPEYVKGEFPDFYKAMFAEQVKRESGRAVFLEYAWNMGSCDPCAADPLSAEELKKLGVFWLDQPADTNVRGRRPPVWGGGAQQVHITRLHVRYNGDTFPEDLTFQETSDMSNFQGRYVIRHPYTGNDQCEAMNRYKEGLRDRKKKEAETLASLTGWKMEDVRAKMKFEVDAPSTNSGGDKWWEKIW